MHGSLRKSCRPAARKRWSRGETGTAETGIPTARGAGDFDHTGAADGLRGGALLGSLRLPRHGVHPPAGHHRAGSGGFYGLVATGTAE